jgi:hypothetical protein
MFTNNIEEVIKSLNSSDLRYVKDRLSKIDKYVYVYSACGKCMKFKYNNELTIQSIEDSVDFFENKSLLFYLYNKTKSSAENDIESNTSVDNDDALNNPLSKNILIKDIENDENGKKNLFVLPYNSYKVLLYISKSLNDSINGPSCDYNSGSYIEWVVIQQYIGDSKFNFNVFGINHGKQVLCRKNFKSITIDKYNDIFVLQNLTTYINSYDCNYLNLSFKRYKQNSIIINVSNDNSNIKKWFHIKNPKYRSMTPSSDFPHLFIYNDDGNKDPISFY